MPQVPTRSALQDSHSDKTVVLAQEDLATRLDVPIDQIELLDIEQVTWPNASLGCPQPDTMYAQVLTPGYRIVLQARDRTYEYHADRNQVVVLCDRGNRSAQLAGNEGAPGTFPVQTPENPYLQRMVALSREDLAGRLAIPADQIELLAIDEVTWPDASLGCPVDGMRYRQVPQDGLLILLRAAGREYEYHSGAGRDPFLCEQPPGALKTKRTPPLDIAPPPAAESK